MLATPPSSPPAGGLLGVLEFLIRTVGSVAWLNLEFFAEIANPKEPEFVIQF